MERREEIWEDVFVRMLEYQDVIFWVLLCLCMGECLVGKVDDDGGVEGCRLSVAAVVGRVLILDSDKDSWGGLFEMDADLELFNHGKF